MTGGEAFRMDLEFGQYRVKRQERLLFGPNGPVELSSRSFDILTVLLDRPNELIGKAALLDAVWPGVAVEENTLQVHISALRKALGPDMIVTVQGRGYKYAGPHPVPVGSAPAANHHPTFEGKPIIVVLPFDNLSGDADQQYFSDGITGEIADRLARFRKFAVIGKHSSAAFRGAAPDFSTIQEKLKADFVVTGSVRRSEGRIRIALRLSDARSEEALWAERYDRPISELFSLQDEISELVAAAIPRQLDVEINVRNARRPPASLSSYEHMLQGYWHFRKLTPASNRAALQCFERAVALDPGNAEAMAWLGAAYCETWVESFAEEFATKGSTLTAKAITIDPFNAMSHAIHTWTLLCVGNLDAALDVSKRSVVLNPGDPAVLVNRALALAYDCKGTEAHALLDLGRRLEPLPPLWFGEFAGVLAFAEGRYAEALEGTEPLVEFAWDAMYALASCGHLGLADRARGILLRLRQQGPDPDWLLGVSREPFKDKEVRERLVVGLNMALAF
jgi:TolB-like protein